MNPGFEVFVLRAWQSQTGNHLNSLAELTLGLALHLPRLFRSPRLILHLECLLSPSLGTVPVLTSYDPPTDLAIRSLQSGIKVPSSTALTLHSASIAASPHFSPPIC